MGPPAFLVAVGYPLTDPFGNEMPGTVERLILFTLARFFGSCECDRNQDLMGESFRAQPGPLDRGQR